MFVFQELQQLGEAIGTESKGLPEDVIALLPTSTYKIRIFSRKEKHDEYVPVLIRYFSENVMCSYQQVVNKHFLCNTLIYLLLL